jgi:hypothetical protein
MRLIKLFEEFIGEQLIPLPTTVTGTYTATNCDELHAFQSTSGKVIGNMNVTVGAKLKEIYDSGVNPKITGVTVTVNGMTVNWEVKIEESKDGNAWVGFTSRGAGCNQDVKTRAESVAFGNDMPTAKTKIQTTYAETNIKIEMVNDYFYNGGPNSFRQVFYRYTKPIACPPITNGAKTQAAGSQGQQAAAIDITGKDLDDLMTKIKTATAGKSLNLSTIQLDMDKLKFSVETGTVPVFSLALRFNLPNEPTCPACDNTVSKNPEYRATSLKTGKFENSTRMYSLIVLYPKS